MQLSFVVESFSVCLHSTCTDKTACYSSPCLALLQACFMIQRFQEHDDSACAAAYPRRGPWTLLSRLHGDQSCQQHAAPPRRARQTAQRRVEAPRGCTGRITCATAIYACTCMMLVDKGHSLRQRSQFCWARAWMMLGPPLPAIPEILASELAAQRMYSGFGFDHLMALFSEPCLFAKNACSRGMMDRLKRRRAAGFLDVE